MHLVSPLGSPKNRKALIVLWSHPHLAVENSASGVAIGLAAFGYAVHLCHRRSPDDLRYCYDKRNDYDLCISLGGPALEATWNDARLYEFVTCRHYFWTLDPIFHDLNRVAETRTYLNKAVGNKRLCFLCPDRTTAAMIAALVPTRSNFFPFGGFFAPLKPQGTSARRHRIAVFGTIGSELAKVRHTQLAEVAKETNPFSMSERLTVELCDAIQAETGASNVARVIRDLLKLDSRKLFEPDVVAFIARIDAFEKRRRRVRVVENLRGGRVDFYGQGWERYVAGSENFAIKPAVRHTEIADTMQNYAAVVNFDPNWDDGVHDRVFTGLGSGCRVITNRNTELPTDAIANGHLLTYDMNAPNFADSLADFVNGAPVSNDAITSYRDRHNWIARMDRFLRIHGGGTA